MKNAIELKDMELGMVNGGDRGDAAKDNGIESRYKVGQEVEVYTNFLHAFTIRKKILKADKDESSGQWCYQIDSLTHKNRYWNIDADDIEAN